MASVDEMKRRLNMNDYTTVYTNNPGRLRKYAPFGMFKNVEASKLSYWEVWCVWHSPQQENEKNKN